MRKLTCITRHHLLGQSCLAQKRLSNPNILFLPLLVGLIGCQPKPLNDNAIVQQTSTTTAPTPIHTLPSSQSKVGSLVMPNEVTSNVASKPKVQDAQVAAQDIAEKLDISYARASAYKSNECPKLVEFRFSSQSITRQDEQLPKQTCDYYVYLRQGEILKIDVSNEVKATLISPVNFDFANGSYTAPKYDKYIVRLSYDGTRFRPQNFKYDVILTKAKSDTNY